MKAEIIAVGTELLLGQIVNTNAKYLAEECAALGIAVYYQTVVGDNMSRLLEVLAIAKGRADVVICTGGLGPTQDDLTKDALAQFLQRDLFFHQPSLDRIKAYFINRNMIMAESNTRQALLVDGGDALMNDNGMAVGEALEIDETSYLLLPGPPKEMKLMFEVYAKPWLQSRLTDILPLHSKMLKFAGIGESSLEKLLLDLIESQSDPSIAPYAKEGEVTIRLTTRAGNKAEADEKIYRAEAEIRRRAGDYLYADQDVEIQQVIIDMLRDRNQTLAVAESCTGGLFSDLVTNIVGSSQAFVGGYVCYTNIWKHRELGVPLDVLEGEGAPGAVSEETARQMALRLLNKSNADYTVSITGVAGPDMLEGKKAGIVYVGIANNAGVEVHQLMLGGDRESVKRRAVKSALYHLWRELKAAQ